MSYKPKHPKSICVAAFPKQFSKLHPERTQAGGVKARSQSEAVRMAVYNGIRELFLVQNPMCQCCEPIYRHVTGGICALVQFTDAVHHTRGRAGLLLFDVRYWKATCEKCHRWIGDHPAEAQKLGLLSKDWNKL